MTTETPETKPDTPDQSSSRPGIGFVRRMKSVLKRGSSSKEAPAATSSTAPAAEHMPHQDQTPAVLEKPAAPAPMESVPADLPVSEDVPFYTTTRQEMFEQRARTIFAKYNLVLDPDVAPLGIPVNNKPVERVHKPVRLRVHRYCHRCETVFGPDRICANCGHGRCKKCPRYPREQDKSSERTEGEVPQKRAKSETREPLLVIQSRRNCQILVHQPIMQRIRRTCHKCQAQFSPSTAAVCGECGHLRCTRCPRTPAKKDKWASGYPGDAEPSSEEEERSGLLRAPKQERVFRKPRQRVRWHCDQCDTLFLEGSRTCRGCGHHKCDNCLRHPPRRNKENFDPAVVDSLHEKLSALVVTAESSS